MESDGPKDRIEHQRSKCGRASISEEPEDQQDHRCAAKHRFSYVHRERQDKCHHQSGRFTKRLQYPELIRPHVHGLYGEVVESGSVDSEPYANQKRSSRNQPKVDDGTSFGRLSLVVVQNVAVTPIYTLYTGLYRSFVSGKLVREYC